MSNESVVIDDQNKELLTRAEVANLLNISIATLWNWEKQGILKKYGIGGRVYYKKSEILESLVEIKS